MENSEQEGLNSLEPPPLASERTVLILGSSGLVLAAVGGSLGFAGQATLDPIRVILCVLGALLSGIALSMRYQWKPAWLLAAGTCLLGSFAIPNSWDTFQLLARVLGGVALAGAIMIWLPLPGRIVFASALVVFHFGGIFTAVTSPNPAPILTRYTWNLIYRPYLQFAYLNNAYQFYSPDPGPASELWFCIEYEPLPGDPHTKHGDDVVYKKIATWVKIPKRFRDFKDPLGQAYYRRLALTEQVVSGTAFTELPWNVQVEILQRRNADKVEPEDDLPRSEQLDFPLNLQYRVPNFVVAEMIVPSYVRFIANQNRRPDREIKAVSVYRVQHWITQPDRFYGWMEDGRRVGTSLMDPITYLPYYFGDYTPDGQLINKDDPLLYWLIPIIKNPAATGAEFSKKPKTLEDYEKLYSDYVIQHSRSNHTDYVSENARGNHKEGENDK